MSSTNRGGKRVEDDFYETPAWCVEALLAQLYENPLVHPRFSVLDPCAGRGAILDVCQAAGHPTRGFEIHPGRAAIAQQRGHAIQQGNALTELAWPIDNAIIMNPPFSLAMPFILAALRAVSIAPVAALLRLNFLASRGRVDFHRTNPADVWVLPKRPSFCASGKCEDGCFAAMQELDKPRPEMCGSCGKKIKWVTSDSIEYAWFVWNVGTGGRWAILGEVK